MTLGITPPLIDYIENGVTLIHPIPFEFQGLEEIVCQRINGSVITPCVEGADFTVTGGGGDPGSVTKTSAGVNGTVFRIKRVTTRGQPTDFVSHDNFPAEDVDIALDRLAAVNQEQEIEATDLEGRTVRVPVGETIAALPPPNDRKGTLFGFSVPTGIRELLTYANVSTLLAPFLAPLLSAINKGDPGGNIMAIGSFLAGPTLNIPVGTDIVRTSCYSTPGKGGAFYENDDATVDAAYVLANPRTAFISANGRGFKLSLDQVINVCMFGAVGDDTANDGAAFVAALAWLYANATPGANAGLGAPCLRIPPGRYYLGAQSLDFISTVWMEGEAAGEFGGAACQLRWDDGVTGLRFQGSDTSGETASGAQTWPGAYGSVVQNLFMKGGYAGVESEHHGVLMRARATVRNCSIQNFPGDGVAILAGADANGGNANNWQLRSLQISQCRDGARADGGDSNAGSGLDVNVSNNRRWGVNDSSFLGNLWHGTCENSGKTPGSIPTIVSYLGNYFAVIAGQEVGAATNPPEATAIDNAWWYACTFAGPPAPAANIPAWFNGIVVRAGGPFRTDSINAQTTILGFYVEPFQGPMQLTPPTLVLGGFNSGNGIRGVSPIHHTDFGIEIPKLQVLDSAVFGRSSGPVADMAVAIDTTSDDAQLFFRAWAPGGILTSLGQIWGHLGSGLFIIGTPAVGIYPNNALAANFTTDGMELAAGMVIKNNGLQVVGPRQGAIPDDTSGSPNSPVVQALVDLVRTHGLCQP